MQEDQGSVSVKPVIRQTVNSHAVTHVFGLFIFALAEKAQSKVIDAGDRVWMLWPQLFFGSRKETKILGKLR